MRPTGLLAMVLAAGILAGCTTYHYVGRMEATDSSGNMRQFVLYWRMTEYAAIYGDNEGAISLLTQCSFNNVLFKERDGGILFVRRRDEDDFIGEPQHAAGDEICGRVEGADKIEDISEGTGALSIKIWCRPRSNSPLRPYLLARDESYVFDIVREKTDEAPKKPFCPPS